MDPSRSLGRAIGKRMFGRPLMSRNPLLDLQMGAQGAYADTAKPFVDFARRPGLATGVGAAITLAPGSPFRAKLARKLASPGPGGQLRPRHGAAEDALDKADSSMILLENQRPSENFMSLFRPFEGEARPGKRYYLKDARPKHGATVEDRVAIIQHPESGTMFAAPNLIHGDLIDYVNEALPGKFPQSYPRWHQHELFDATPDINAPARLMHGMNERRDTEIATYARAKLIGKLHKAGIKTGMAKKAPSYRERLSRPIANQEAAALLREILNRGSKHPGK